MFGALINSTYLCIEQLVILIYIYHFPRGNLSVKIDSFFLYTCILPLHQNTDSPSLDSNHDDL